jgi:hypothetical protein
MHYKDTFFAGIDNPCAGSSRVFRYYASFFPVDRFAHRMAVSRILSGLTKDYHAH